MPTDHDTCQMCGDTVPSGDAWCERCGLKRAVMKYTETIASLKQDNSLLLSRIDHLESVLASNREARS